MSVSIVSIYMILHSRCVCVCVHSMEELNGIIIVSSTKKKKEIWDVK
jgi:hypothetical protein